jgi:hypothetical protein
MKKVEGKGKLKKKESNFLKKLPLGFWLIESSRMSQDHSRMKEKS